jgi:short-subunit dehydrogenase
MRAGTRALVTGASSGIGEEFARQLAARGWPLVLVARSEDRLSVVRASITARDPQLDVRVIALDLAEPGAPAELFARLYRENAPVSLLVNNAGFGAFGDFAAIDANRQRRMIDLNVAALVELSHLFLAQAESARQPGAPRPAIINIASVAGFVPLPYSAVYAATKAFVLSFSLALAEEARQRGVQVLAVNPGSTQTNFFEVAGKTPFGHPARMQTSAQVVREALRAFDRGKTMVTTGIPNKAMVFATRWLPRSVITAMVGAVMRKSNVHQQSG